MRGRCIVVKLAGLALVALVGACTTNATPQANRPSPAASLSPAAVNPPSPTWTLGLGRTSVSTVDFSCRLPVFSDAGQGSTGGFIQFPSGTVTPDPAAAGLSVARFGRELVGNSYVHYYDRAAKRWLPVSRNAVSADGTHYGYADRAVDGQADPQARASFHLVDVGTGVELSFDDGPWAAPYEILDYASEGIYLVTPFGGSNGLWLMAPKTSATTQVADLANVQGSGGNKVFWLGAINPADPKPIAGVTPDQVDRLSLVDGTRVPWFYRPGSSAHFVSQDVAGHPIVIAGGVSGQQEFVILDQPGSGRSIWTTGDKVPAIGSPISDSHGVWFGSPDGIFLYSQTHGVQKVSNQPGYPANGCF